MVKSTSVKLALNRTRFRKWLERANDLDALTLVWAVDALQSGGVQEAARYIAFPREAAVASMDEKLAIYKWELETIVTSLLTTSKDKERVGRHRMIDLRQFGSLAALVRFLRAIEGGEYARTGIAANIWEEMYRIGQRQFSWQRGYNSEQLYRYAFVYGQGECGSFFEAENRISVSTFMFFSFAAFSLATERAWITAPDVSQIGRSQSDLNAAFGLLSADLPSMRTAASKLNAEAARKQSGVLRTAYMPSILRQRPMITITRGKPLYCAPLPPLIMHRATTGLYYDIKQGPTRSLTDANSRFEEYVRRLLGAYYPRFETLKGSAYGSKAFAVDPPDCLIKDGGSVTVAIECKATKLTFDAQFAEDPSSAARQGFEQLAKGVFQLWRFFSHARRGLYTEHPVSANAHGIVLTMDSWMQMADKLREGALVRARQLASQDPEITSEDMRMVVFASVQELNDVAAQTGPDQFMQVLDAAVSVEFKNYGLPEVARDAGVEAARRGYPLDVAEILPWWDEIKDPNERPLL